MSHVADNSLPAPNEDENGVDIDQIRFMLSLTPDQRLQVLERTQRLILEARRAAESA